MSGDPKPATSSERPVVLLVDGDGLERRLIDEWLERQQPGQAREVLRIPSTRAWDAGRADPTLAARLARGDDPLLTPVRVAWLPREHQGERSVRLFDLLTLGNPRAPSRLGKRWVLARHPDRCRVVLGEAASASTLRERWRQTGGEATEDVTASFAQFVLRQAALALERAERPLRGARYKVPRFVRQEVLAHQEFRAGLATLTASTGLSAERIQRRATRYLEEIAARVSPYVIDLVHRLIGVVYRQGYARDLDYDRPRLQALLTPKPGQTVVFLPTHKSNLDHAILQYLLYANGSPPNHTAGGINMNFFPIGPVFRRTGVFFIRRSFKDNPVYKFVLRQYVDFLVEKRFSLEWYIEGGRSRTGKLLPPRFGMLAYVVDSWRRGRADDVLLVPVSIAYDQISDVGDYAHEARGGAKQKEGLGWFVGMLRALKRRYGQIHVRFGEPVSLKASLGAPEAAPAVDADEKNLPVQKLAFEVCHRINRATPITPSAALCLALLGGGHRAVTVEELRLGLGTVLGSARARGLPTAGPVEELETAEGLTRHLSALAANGVVRCFDEGPEPVWSVAPTQFLTAAYYRNTVLHFFVTGAIAELALLHAAAAEGDKRQAFDDEAMRLRDLLKFEFFFAEKDAFKKALADEVAFQDAGWETAFARGEDAVEAVVRAFKPFSAHRVLRPFIDADRIVADALLREGAATVEEAPFIGRCLALGKQYVMQRLVHSEESVSKVLFATAYKLAANRSLLSGEGVQERRRAFAAQLKDVVRRIDAVESLAAARLAGLID